MQYKSSVWGMVSKGYIKHTNMLNIANCAVKHGLPSGKVSYKWDLSQDEMNPIQRKSQNCLEWWPTKINWSFRTAGDQITYAKLAKVWTDSQTLKVPYITDHLFSVTTYSISNGGRLGQNWHSPFRRNESFTTARVYWPLAIKPLRGHHMFLMSPWHLYRNILKLCASNISIQISGRKLFLLYASANHI